MREGEEIAFPLPRTQIKAIKSEAEELLGECRRTLLPHWLAVSDATTWKKLFSTFGHKIGLGFLADTDSDELLRERSEALFSALSAMLTERSVAEQAAAPLAKRLPQWLRVSESAGSFHDRSSTLTDAQRLHIAVAASFLVRGKADHHVGRLEVTVDDSFLVSVVDRGADVAKKFESAPRAELLLLAKLGDGDPFDQIHREPGPAAGGGSRVEDPRDVCSG